ncbi:hypothetical protein F4604DRAFT_1688917 [Suillus subluteus]|nr:hypothetical protein F4604DRAFT_1688900 [Suillus subluteus]KAG1845009.1 hypothetical protein F4604DRAFT_1688917 [Suillus subluteus]
MVKSARTFSPVRHMRDSCIRDGLGVGERDAPSINEANGWWLRNTTTSSPELSEALEIVEWGIRTFGSHEDKLQLVKVLVLSQVIDVFESKTRAEQVARGSEEDEGEGSYRDALGRLLSVLGLGLSNRPRWNAEVADFIRHTLLTSYKRSRKVSTDPLEEFKWSSLVSLLQFIMQKMK